MADAADGGSQSALVRRVDGLPHRLADYGYTVSTGPLVWNRHKPSLRDRPGKGRFPLVWAESVRAEGVFEFRAEKRSHKPWFEPKANKRWVVTDVPCVLLHRTTAKEQCRRLIAAELPATFIEEHGAVVVENHQQHEYLGVADQGTRRAAELALAEGQIRNALVEHRVVNLRKTLDEVVGADRGRRRLHPHRVRARLVVASATLVDTAIRRRHIGLAGLPTRNPVVPRAA